MKNRLVPVVLLSALFIVVSCSKSFDSSEEGKLESKVFTASIDDDNTKTTLQVSDKNYINWINGDAISINGVKFVANTAGGSPATTATFTKSDSKANPTGPYNAYYPYSIYDGTTATLPATQTYNSNYPFSVNPMYATSSSTSLSFCNLCGILAVTVKSADFTNVKTITVASSNRGMCGEFTVTETSSGSGKYYAKLTDAAIKARASVTLDCGTDGASTTEAGTTFYIAIPAQSYNDISIIVNGTHIMYTKNPVTVERNKIYSFNYSGTQIPTPTPLSGDFSVSATKTVKFSKGNLQAVYSTSTSSYAWRFAANQYDYIGNAAGNTSIGSQEDGNVVDLFGWSADGIAEGVGNNYKPWGINTFDTDEDYYGDFVDWGTNPSLISAFGSGWRTLSSEEWLYLLYDRDFNGEAEGGKGDGYSYLLAWINSDVKYGEDDGVHGLILYPDDYTKQLDPEVYNITSDQWSEMVKDGCVFLPAAGYRYTAEVYDCGSYGRYWSSTPEEDDLDYAYYLYFEYYYPDTNWTYISYGGSVRLVR